ncbi:hypothetical protein K461DRAFT_274940 [Myriangium duriaei CBS 260.36]|uniref:RTA1 domain-containing protein n=1 Tax=Myriangium duriaei CBS 260.36 TaxID=1168546 RepID=A0A9P4MK43_9PEZI|nr:hypothetical protein K461DRAFT_274940 [Myriangium duriaei CBS 260.36]
MFSATMSLIPRESTDWTLYPYNPAKPLPYIFAVIIFILGCINVWQNFFHWKWTRFGFIMTWASAVWVAGFACRAVSQAQPKEINIYIAQYVLVLLGPPLYGGAETFILGRLMAYLPYLAPLHPGRVVTTFVILSAIVEVVSAQGASRLAGGAKPVNLGLLTVGSNLLNAALILQSFVEIFFLCLTAQLHVRAKKAGTFPRQVKIMVYVLYTTSSMILVRCIFRAVQGFQSKQCILTGSCGASLTIEALFWIFEVANITLFVTALTIWTPGRFLPHSDKVFLDKNDATTERVGPGFANKDTRPWIVTLFDPFNVAGRISGKHQGRIIEPFWEEQHPVHDGDLRTTQQQTVTATHESPKQHA